MSSQSSFCGSCVFFDEHHLNGGQPSVDEGLCRYNPPISQPTPHKHGLWPVVTDKDWCGHFTAEPAGRIQAAE